MSYCAALCSTVQPSTVRYAPVNCTFESFPRIVSWCVLLLQISCNECVTWSCAANGGRTSIPANHRLLLRQHQSHTSYSAWRRLLTNLVLHSVSASATRVPNWQGKFGFGVDRRADEDNSEKNDCLQTCQLCMETLPILIACLQHRQAWLTSIFDVCIC